jgi:hypothetical protein
MFLFNYQSDNRLVVNDFLATNLGPKIEPSSDHYTRALTIDTVVPLGRRSPLYIKIYIVNIYKARKVCLYVKS